MDNHVYSPFIQCFPVDLVITRYPEILSVVPRILWAYCLAVLCHLNTLRIILALIEYPLIPQLFMCFTKVFEIPFDLPKILSSLLLLKFLLACIMVNPISLLILLASLVIIILSPLIQFVVKARNPQSDPSIHPSGSDVILNMSWFSTNQIAVDCTPKSIQLIHPWSERLLLIPWFGNHNSFAFDNWVSQLFL